MPVDRVQMIKSGGFYQHSRFFNGQAQFFRLLTRILAPLRSPLHRRAGALWIIQIRFARSERIYLTSVGSMLAFLATPTALVAHSPLSAARGSAPAEPALRRAEAANMIVVPPAFQHGPKCTPAESAPWPGLLCLLRACTWRLWVARHCYKATVPTGRAAALGAQS